MKCPSCNITASSFLRTTFSLQGVSFSKAIQGYLKCQHCGTLLRLINPNQVIVLAIITGVASVAAYVLLFPSISSLVGFELGVGLFFPFIIIIGLSAASLTLVKFARFMIVDEKKGAKIDTAN